jgi:hypothetical protein
MLFVEKHHSLDAPKKKLLHNHKFQQIKLIITNLTPPPSQKKPIWHLQKVEGKKHWMEGLTLRAIHYLK